MSAIETVQLRRPNAAGARLEQQNIHHEVHSEMTVKKKE